MPPLRRQRTENEFDFVPSFTISASLAILFDLLQFPEYTTSSPVPQLAVLQSGVNSNGMHGAPLGGEFSIPVRKWLASLGEHTSISEMTESMRTAYRKMFPFRFRYYHEHDFHASVDYHNGWLNISCPGNACGLNPTRIEDGDKGYKFSCHNLDTPMQQITLLAGLAALHDRARREIKT